MRVDPRWASSWFASIGDIDMLAYLGYGEASGETWGGQLAVMHTALNRVSLPWWPDKLRYVILQDQQFDGLARLGTERFPLPIHLTVMAEMALDGLTLDPSNGATHFCRHDVFPFWRNQFEYRGRIGDHVFYFGH